MSDARSITQEQLIELIKDIQDGSLEKIKKAIENNNDLLGFVFPCYIKGIGENNHGTLIHHAAFYNKTEILTYLLDQFKARHPNDFLDILNNEGKYKSTPIIYAPLHMASITGSVSAIEILLKYGSNVDVNGNGVGYFTPLYFAAEFGKQDVVDLLVNHGANLVSYETRNKENLLTKMIDDYYNAMNQNNEEGLAKIQNYIKRNSSFLFLNYSQRPPLLLAAAINNNLELFKYAYEQMINEKRDPLTYTVSKIKMPYIVDMSKAFENRTALELAARDNAIAVFKYLVEEKEAPIKDTIIKLAIENNAKDIVEYLIETRNDDVKTVINVAYETGDKDYIFRSINEEMTRLLLGGGIDPLIFLKSGRSIVDLSTSFANAVMSNDRETVIAYLKKSPNWCAITLDESGNNALHLASMYQHKDLIKTIQDNVSKEIYDEANGKSNSFGRLPAQYYLVTSLKKNFTELSIPEQIKALSTLANLNKFEIIDIISQNEKKLYGSLSKNELRTFLLGMFPTIVFLYMIAKLDADTIIHNQNRIVSIHKNLFNKLYGAHKGKKENEVFMDDINNCKMQEPVSAYLNSIINLYGLFDQKQNYERAINHLNQIEFNRYPNEYTKLICLITDKIAVEANQDPKMIELAKKTLNDAQATIAKYVLFPEQELWPSELRVKWDNYQIMLDTLENPDESFIKEIGKDKLFDDEGTSTVVDAEEIDPLRIILNIENNMYSNDVLIKILSNQDINKDDQQYIIALLLTKPDKSEVVKHFEKRESPIIDDVNNYQWSIIFNIFNRLTKNAPARGDEEELEWTIINKPTLEHVNLLIKLTKSIPLPKAYVHQIVNNIYEQLSIGAANFIHKDTHKNIKEAFLLLLAQKKIENAKDIDELLEIKQEIDILLPPLKQSQKILGGLFKKEEREFTDGFEKLMNKQLKNYFVKLILAERNKPIDSSREGSSSGKYEIPEKILTFLQDPRGYNPKTKTDSMNVLDSKDTKKLDEFINKNNKKINEYVMKQLTSSSAKPSIFQIQRRK